MTYKKYNKGEWTEIYVLFHLLAESRLYKGDISFKKLSNFSRIAKIFHYEKVGKVEFTIDTTHSRIIIKKNGYAEKIIPVQEFLEKSRYLLNEIKRQEGSSFALPDAEDFLKSIYCVYIKQSAKNIKDIEIEICEQESDVYELLSFSIKSKLGSLPTLFNPNKKTNFVYRIEGIDKTIQRELNQLPSATQIVKEIHNRRYRIIFDESTTRDTTPTLYRNLILVDDAMPTIVANLLLNSYSGENNRSITELHRAIVRDNPCNYFLQDVEEIYERKIKDFLTEITLGLKASDTWKKDEMPHGFIMVRKDGEVLAYHLLERKIFENCLFIQTKLDVPSRSRYDYGMIKEINGKFYIKLCLQVRFR